MTDAVTLDRTDAVGVIHIDDGKVNALSHSVIEGIESALDGIEGDPDVRAVVVIGRPGRFSAGFDLDTMSAGAESARALVEAGARMAMRLYGLPRPVVAACTGHALAAGAVMLLASDLRLGADVDAKVGLNEVAIGLPLPVFAVELARARLSRRHYTRATSLATIYTPAEAVDVGYLDEVVPATDVEALAVSRASELGTTLGRAGFARTRANDRQATIDMVLETLEEDLSGFGSGE